MLHKTRGIVLKTMGYRESSVIVKIYTEKFGLQSYMVNGVKKAKAKISMNLLQPLHLLDMVVYYRPNSQLQRISEARATPVFKSIPYEVLKNAIVQFLNEVVYKSIQQPQHDPHLFEFIYQSLCWFDESENLSVNFHLAFLLKLSRFLGFAPDSQVRTDQQYFDLQEGRYTSLHPLHPHFIGRADAEELFQLYFSPFEKLNDFKFSNAKRRFLLDKLLVYYELHSVSFGVVKSRQVLEEILS